MKCFVSWSGGKDCSFSLYLFRQANPDAQLHLLHMNRVHDRRAHRISKSVFDAQAAAMGLGITRVTVDQIDRYGEYFHQAMLKLKEQGMDHGIFGDIYLETHREWVEQACAKAGITPIFPLWGMSVEEIYRQFIAVGFKSLVITVQKKEGYEALLGKYLGPETDGLISQFDNFDKCGELGEYHSFVADGPTFQHPVEWRLGKAFENEKLRGFEIHSPVELLLIRHGQTLENTQNICQGQTKGTLSPKGIAQAEKLHTELQSESFDALYSSDLSRAHISAKLIFGEAAPIILDKRLRERAFGVYEGQLLPEGLNFDDDIEGTETLASLFERITDFLQMLSEEHGGQKVALVSHGVVIKSLLSLCEEKDFTRIPIPKNCTPLRILL